MFADLRRNLSILVTLLFTGLVRGEECGQEELVRCSRPLQVLSETSELTFVTKKEELDKLCPDLYTGLRCIHSYTLRCMNLHQRTHFNRLYAGTNSVIKELCTEGEYQLEFLRHAPCMRSVKGEYESCARQYQRTMTGVANTASNVTGTAELNQQIKTICCSFQEYMGCSEHTVRRTCGDETAAFTRAFLDKMASSLILMHCADYSSGSRACDSAYSGAPTPVSQVTLLLAAVGATLLVALRTITTP